MNTGLRPFLFKLFLLTIGISFILVAGEYTRPDLFGTFVKWPILGLFVLATWIQHYFIMHPDNQRPATMVRMFMASSAIKLMAYIILIVLFILFYRTHARKVIIWFLVFYSIFTVFENAVLFKHFRSSKKD